MGVEWGGDGEDSLLKRRKKPVADNSAGAKALGWDPQTGWGPGLGVNSMPGAPGANDAAIFAAQRARNLSAQQFGGLPPENFDEDGLPVGWQGKPPTSEEMGY